jgi:hypothetical protein
VEWEDEEIGEEEQRAVLRSKQWFKSHAGTPIQIRNCEDADRSASSYMKPRVG